MNFWVGAAVDVVKGESIRSAALNSELGPFVKQNREGNGGGASVGPLSICSAQEPRKSTGTNMTLGLDLLFRDV